MYEVFEHTADVGIRIRAADLKGLFEEAARGLFAILVANLEAVRPVQETPFRLEGDRQDDLLFDWLAVSAVWERIKGYALGVRQGAGNPRLYENFEALAAANAAYDARLAKRSSATKRAKK